MRETIEPEETIEECLARGLQEEFGATGTMRHYIGSIVSKFPLTNEGPLVEKTTLYFLCDVTSFDLKTRKKDDLEAGSDLVWIKPAELVIKMSEQGKRLKREDADESEIIQKAIKFI